MIFNEGQEKALEEIEEFRKNDELFHTLSGSAGSGKTTITRAAIQNIGGLAVSAPTHKAKKQIQKSTGIQAVTMQSLLGLRPNVMLEEYDSRNPLFSQIGKNTMGDYSFVCIDESSMVNNDAADLIKKVANENRTKILFIGDPNQLPPINKNKVTEHGIELPIDRISKVFRDEAIKISRLTQVERQKNGNPLMDIYSAILSNMDSPIDLFERKSIITDGLGIKFFYSRKDFANKMVDAFKSNMYEEDKNYFKLLAYRNNTVKSFNNYVRKMIYGGINVPLCIGECLMSYDSVFDTRIRDYIIQNSFEYRVVETKESTKDGITGLQCKIQDIDDGVFRDVFIIHNNIVNNKKYSEKYLKLEQNAQLEKNETPRKQKWKMLYDYKKEFFTIGDIKNDQNEVVVKKSFDFSYGITIHKSQGSTYNSVFIDEPDININQSSFQRNRLKYVALSRPTNISVVNCV